MPQESDLVPELLKPPALKAGDTIGIVSPASPIAAICPARFQRGVRHLEGMGFQVEIAPDAQARHGHTAGTIDQRVEDLHRMFGIPAVKAIITTIGGYNSYHLLDRLDYDFIQATLGHDLRIAMDFDFGHTDPMVILPQGIRACVSFRDEPAMTLLDMAVCQSARG